MPVTLTITLGEEVLRTLTAAKSISIVLGTAKGKPGPGVSRSSTAGRGGTARVRRAAGAASGGFQPGSLGDRLVRWASGRAAPFGFPELMKLLRVSRAHSHMILARARAKGLLKRVGHGAYAAASMPEDAVAAWRRAVPFRRGSQADRLLRWAAGRRRHFRTADVMRTLRLTRALATKALMRTVAAGRLRRVGHGTYTAA